MVEITFADGDPSVVALVPGVAPPQGEIDVDALGPTNEIYQLPE